MTKTQRGCQSTHPGPCRGNLWQCAECKRQVCYADGSDNDLELCDDCWNDKHGENE